jgi:hypothetical protein
MTAVIVVVVLSNNTIPYHHHLLLLLLLLSSPSQVAVETPRHHMVQFLKGRLRISRHRRHFPDDETIHQESRDT